MRGMAASLLLGAMASPRRDEERKLQHDSFDRMGKHLHVGLRIWCPCLRRTSVHRGTAQISFTMHAPLHVHVHPDLVSTVTGSVETAVVSSVHTEDPNHHLMRTQQALVSLSRCEAIRSKTSTTEETSIGQKAMQTMQGRPSSERWLRGARSPAMLGFQVRLLATAASRSAALETTSYTGFRSPPCS